MIRESFKNMTDPVAVIGDGWAALATCRFLMREQVPVVWIQASGARILPVLPSLAHGSGVAAWRKLAELASVETGNEHSGCFLREFRNKAFREPLWTKAPTVEARGEVIREVLWGAETTFTGPFETRFELSLEEIEARIRAFEPNPERVEGLPVIEFKTEGKKVSAVVLGSGREIACSQVVYADSWSQLPKIAGLPKALPFTRKRESVGVLQAVLQHEVPVGQSEPGSAILEGFFGSLHRESGESFDRHVFGYFLDEGRKSIWSLAVSSDEAEDNHAIGKKLRRMKSAVDKMFVGSSWVPEKGFLANIRSEQVRFVSDVAFASGDPIVTPQRIPAFENAAFLTDGYGPSCALAQVSDLLFESTQAETQTEPVHVPPPADA